MPFIWQQFSKIWPQPSITEFSLKITYVNFHSNLPEANELNAIFRSGHEFAHATFPVLWWMKKCDLVKCIKSELEWICSMRFQIRSSLTFCEMGPEIRLQTSFLLFTLPIKNMFSEDVLRCIRKKVLRFRGPSWQWCQVIILINEIDCCYLRFVRDSYF